MYEIQINYYYKNVKKNYVVWRNINFDCNYNQF